MAISDAQIKKQLKALRSLIGNDEKQNPFEDRDEIRLQIQLQKIVTGPANKLKMTKIKLPHSVLKDDAHICMIVGDVDPKDRTKIPDTIEAYETALRKEGITQISEIMPILKLKLEYQPYEAKRMLIGNTTRFIADAKLMRRLPKLLGKTMYETKKYPFQVKVDLKRRKEFASQIQSALNSTAFVIAKGHTSSLVVARTGMKDKEVLVNIQAALQRVLPNIPGGMQNLKCLAIQSGTTPSLPIYVSKVPRQAVKLDVVDSKENRNVSGSVSTIREPVTITADGTVMVHKAGNTVKTIAGGKRVVVKKEPKRLITSPARAKKVTAVVKKRTPKAKLLKTENVKSEEI